MGTIAEKGHNITFTGWTTKKNHPLLNNVEIIPLPWAEKLYNAAKENNADMAVCGFERIDLKTNKVVGKDMTKQGNTVKEITSEEYSKKIESLNNEIVELNKNELTYENSNNELATSEEAIQWLKEKASSLSY